jgi:hypothetical protein
MSSEGTAVEEAQPVVVAVTLSSLGEQGWPGAD